MNIAAHTSHKKRRGFTLVELAVAISILAIIFTIAMLSYRGLRNQSYREELIGDLQQVAMNLDEYKASRGEYPELGSEEYMTDVFEKSRSDRVYTYVTDEDSPRLSYCVSTTAHYEDITYRVGSRGASDADVREGTC